MNAIDRTRGFISGLKWEPADSSESLGRRVFDALGIDEIHPSVKKLVRWQMAAKFRRTLQRMGTRRRLPLTIAALLLGFLWLAQALAGILFRETASPEKLFRWIPISLCCYLIWNVVKVFGQKPIEPFSWTESEKEWLIASPLKRSEVIRYRCSSILRAAFIKSTIFALIMSPDIEIVLYGFLGIFVALLLIDLVRILLAIVVYGLRPRELMYGRVLIFGAAAISVGTAVASTLYSVQFSSQMESAASFGLLLQLFDDLVSQTTIWYGATLIYPFRVLAEIILSTDFTVAVLGKLILVSLVIAGLAKLVPCLDEFFCQRRVLAERAGFRSAQRKQQANTSLQLRSIPKIAFRFGGCGALAWRQWRGVITYSRSLMAALLIPMVLSLLPVLNGKSGLALIANIVASIMFYSVLLLPPTLKFDFRRDIDRLTILKSLPLSPNRIVAGQLAMPVLLTTLFQFVTLVLFQFISPFSPLIMAAIVIAFLPFNLFLYSFENLLFMWYPHRLHQEGIQVLLRSILIFTAKTIVFLLILGVTFIWALGSRWFVETMLPDFSLVTSRTLFATGMFLMAATAAIATFRLLARAFEKFDPSRDLAGLD